MKFIVLIFENIYTTQVTLARSTHRDVLEVLEYGQWHDSLLRFTRKKYAS